MYGALVMVGGGKRVIQLSLALYPSAQAHQKRWEELLAEGWNRLPGKAVLKDALGEGHLLLHMLCVCLVNLPCFLTHHTSPNFRYVLDLFLMELPRESCRLPSLSPL